jgi:hypothetical protein
MCFENPQEIKKQNNAHRSVLPDSGVHRYFSQIYRKVKPVSTKSSGKIAEFSFDRI